MMVPCFLSFSLLLPTATLAAQPEGYLDSATSTVIGGWARDPDNTGPIAVHIYIDGEIAHAMVADALRSDLPYADQNHGFTWTPPFLGSGTHQVNVYAIGVDASGAADGVNPDLTGSPTSFTGSCAGASEPALTWCNGVPAYYANRAADTTYLYNDQIRVGVNGSYGGTILELYGADHSVNLLAEHGGGAVQLSVWGYEERGSDGWFPYGDGVCVPTSYSSESACLAAGHGACRLWCCDEGAHVPDCTSVTSCVDWGAGAPFNPIQAQARDCGWDSSSNDVDSLTASGSTVTTRKSGPYHFTQSDSFSGMVFEQSTTLHDAFVEIDYRITYSGPYTLSAHPQEIPAVFPSAGMNHSYHYYTGSSPYSDAGSAVSHSIGAADAPLLGLTGRDPWPHGSVDETITEHWVSACDASDTRCLTLAVFAEQYKEIDLAGYPGDGYGYLTPLGDFPIEPGLDERFTAFLFPGRYDANIAGKTVREWIFELAATELPPEDEPEDTGDGPDDPKDTGDGPDDPKDTGDGPDDPKDTDEDPGDPDDTQGDDPDDPGDPDDSDDPSHPPGAQRDDAPTGCGCQSGGTALSLLPLLLGVPLLRRRSRR
jgi:hypothetical protein